MSKNSVDVLTTDLPLMQRAKIYNWLLDFVKLWRARVLTEKIDPAKPPPWSKPARIFIGVDIIYLDQRFFLIEGNYNRRLKGDLRQ